MLVNLSTLEFVEGPHVVQAWCHALGLWVCVVEQRSAQPPPGALELTYDEICRVARLRSQGHTKRQALAAVGVPDGLLAHAGV